MTSIFASYHNHKRARVLSLCVLRDGFLYAFAQNTAIICSMILSQCEKSSAENVIFRFIELRLMHVCSAHPENVNDVDLLLSQFNNFRASFT